MTQKERRTLKRSQADQRKRFDAFKRQMIKAHPGAASFYVSVEHGAETMIAYDARTGERFGEQS